MATTPRNLKAGDSAIKILETRMKSADATPEFKALAKKQIARYKQMNSALESNAMKQYRALLRAGHKDEAYKLGLKIKDRTVSYADLGMNEPSKFKQGMQNLEEKFGGDNLVSTVKGAMALAILDVLGADILAKSVVTGLAESGALANLLPTLITFAMSNPVAAVCLVAVAYLGIKKLFGPIVKKMQAKMELNMELDSINLENADGDLIADKSLDEFISDYEKEHPKKKGTKGKDKENHNQNSNEEELDENTEDLSQDELTEIFGETEVEQPDSQRTETEETEVKQPETNRTETEVKQPETNRTETEVKQPETNRTETEVKQPETLTQQVRRLESEVDKAARKARKAYLAHLLALNELEKAKNAFKKANDEFKKDTASSKKSKALAEATTRLEAANKNESEKSDKYSEADSDLYDAITALVEAQKKMSPDLDTEKAIDDKYKSCGITKKNLKESITDFLSSVKGAGGTAWQGIKNFGKLLWQKGDNVVSGFQAHQQKSKESSAQAKELYDLSADHDKLIESTKKLIAKQHGVSELKDIPERDLFATEQTAMVEFKTENYGKIISEKDITVKKREDGNHQDNLTHYKSEKERLKKLQSEQERAKEELEKEIEAARKTLKNAAKQMYMSGNEEKYSSEAYVKYIQAATKLLNLQGKAQEIGKNIAAISSEIENLSNYIETTNAAIAQEESAAEQDEINEINEDDSHPIVLEDEEDAKTPVSQEQIVSGFTSVGESVRNVGKNKQGALNTAYSNFIGNFNRFVGSIQGLETGSKKSDVEKLKSDASSSLGSMEAALRDLDTKKAFQNHPSKESLKELFTQLLDFAKELQAVLEAKAKEKKTASIKDKLSELGLDTKEKNKATKLTGNLDADLKMMIETEKS